MMKKSVYKKASTSKTGKPAKMMMGGMPKKKKDSDMSMMMGGMPKKKKAYGTSMMMGGMAKKKAYKKKMQNGGMSAFGTTKANTTSNPGSLMKRTTSPKKKVTNLVSFAKNGGMAKKKKY